ncbi:MAG: BrnA antitoxin family protein [Deltaproteobacteria bacterium]|nr:BrnA antitoxin family protein [Deltaproteobacteria bacterium]
MKKEYDFSKGNRGRVVPAPSPGGKERITIRLDEDILQWFRDEVDSRGGGNYQTLINAALREHISGNRESLEDVVRRALREELKTKAS